MDHDNRLNIAIVGLGYVGVTAAACLSSQGHRVYGVDVVTDKVDVLNRGESPIVEAGVPELVASGVADGLLTASTIFPPIDEVDLVIVCVGTPSASDGSHNMAYIAESTRQIARAIAASTSRSRVTVAFRSTFRPGTMEHLIAPIFEELVGDDFGTRVELVYNPEFLRESSAVQDYFHPPKIVVGTDAGSHSEVMGILHLGLDAPTFETGFREAEITKFIDNSWHAVKVAFANEVGRVCDAYDVDATVAHSIFVSDTKLNISPYYTRPGGAFGGSCLPKDVRAMQYIAASADVEVQLLDSLMPTNATHKDFQLERVMRATEAGASILVVGIAFKAGTDDMRESPNVKLVADLVSHGYRVHVLDPYVHTSSLMGQNLGHVMTQLPNLRKLLISEEAVAEEHFDLVVLNHAELDMDMVSGVPVIDLRVIGGRRESKGVNVP